MSKNWKDGMKRWAARVKAARGGGRPEGRRPKELGIQSTKFRAFPQKNLESEEFTHEGEFSFSKVISQDADTAGNTIGSMERKKRPGSLFPIVPQPFAGCLFTWHTYLEEGLWE